MPEGPEVRTIADKLRAKFLRNRNVKIKVKDIQLSEDAKVINFDSFSELKQAERHILKIYSYGKKLIIELGTLAPVSTESTSVKLAIVFSLGMTGSIRYKKTNHSHLTFFTDTVENGVDGVDGTVENGNEFYFHDVRKFGDVNFIPLEDNTSTVDVIKEYYNLGPDLLEHALTKNISSKEWKNIFQRKSARGLAIGKRTISTVLLEQDFLAGIGNYLKSEILYYSSILPDRLANSLTEDEWETLRKVSHHIIAVSYSYGGLTIESFISPDGSSGDYPAAVYGKKLDPDGNPVVAGKTKDGRKSFWVSSVQQ